MKEENAKILIALILKSESGVFLKRQANGLFGLPSRFLEKDQQPDDATKALAVDLGIQESDILSSQTDLKNVSTGEKNDENIVVILTTYFLAGNVLSNSGLTEINAVDLASVRLTKTTAEALGVAESTQKNAQNEQISEVNNIITEPAQQSSEKSENEHKTMHVFSDGGSRGNPGPSACGFVIEDENHIEIYRGGEYLGVTTNNQAEYHGVRLSLEKALELGARSVDFKGDSLLVINQLNGIYKIKNKDLWPIYERIKEMIPKFDKVTFTHVYREHNRGADAMVNEILDQHAENNR
jgi:ribonuclease HI